MVLSPAVIVHGLPQANAVLRAGLPVTLLSAAGAGQFAGCLWWRALVAAARQDAPDTPMLDILDCADASGLAMGAIRCGVVRLVLWPEAPGWQAVASVAQACGGFVLPEAPAALDMAERGASRRLHAWLHDRQRLNP